MKKVILKILLFVYNRVRRLDIIRNLIKKIIGNKKVTLFFKGFYINVGVTSSIENAVIFNEYNEIIVLKIIKYYASLGYDFIDIGANIGLHSMTAASSNSKIDIFSYEPEPNNYLDFIKNIGINNHLNIRPFKMGLGNFSGINYLNINEGWNRGKHSLKVEFEEYNSKINIPITKLDFFKDNIRGDFLLIKIDVEGFEKEVLEGAKQVIKQTKNIVIIIELLVETNGYENCQEITFMLKEYNFESIFKINEKDELIKVLDFEGSADYVFLKGQNMITNF